MRGNFAGKQVDHVLEKRVKGEALELRMHVQATRDHRVALGGAESDGFI